MKMAKEKYLIENKIIIEEWDYKKNSQLNLDPTKLGYYSNKKAWWKCSKGHEWDEIIANRTRRNSGCPICSNHRIV